ncbi:class I SAM-dependent methyltransferase [Spirulina sp. 06S082]|uniref:class I SAM-dependent methyltransferase n=1 Tax=Spirulina sp. 06S082 TaxID=3110248 RepID=UPI002B21592B|nr:class I SAM-dependent methyltransferase [Spirulina sp. 06S082]MEA5467373.1 class I SAM-dependent methyltransferase [Spirulina sp. 06S082]
MSESIDYSQIDYSRHYNQWHSDTPEHFEQMKFYYQKLLGKFLPSDYQSSILDIGCGQGFAMMTLQELGYKTIEGIDVDEQQINFCLQKKLKVTQVEDTIAFLADRKEKYHLILLLDVLEHIPLEKQLTFTRKIQEALKEGGQLIGTVPNANSSLASRWRYIDWTHYLSFTEYSLDFLLFNAGFQDICIYETEFFDAPNFNFLFSRAILKKSYWKTLLHYFIFRCVRYSRRLTAIAELSWEQGLKIPLSLNLLVSARKSETIDSHLET